MGMLVNSGASIACSFGTAPGILKATSSPLLLIEGKPVATIMDAIPIVNISKCGMCTTLKNPAVATATAAALGVLTPQPCTPKTMSWTPTNLNVLAGVKPCVTQDCVCMCAYGGAISVTSPGQLTVSS